MNANTRKMNRLTLAAAALLFTAVPLAAPSAQALISTRTIRVAMTYDRTAPAEQIYASLQRQAWKACGPETFGHQRLNRVDRRCIAQLVGRAVDKIGRPALAELHARSSYNAG